jgi:hypothetical protein
MCAKLGKSCLVGSASGTHVVLDTEQFSGSHLQSDRHDDEGEAGDAADGRDLEEALEFNVMIF